MDEYINKRELIENLKQFAPEHYTSLIDLLIRNQPRADVATRVEGEILEAKDEYENAEKSVCDYIEKVKYEFCMRNGRSENEKIFEVLDLVGKEMKGEKQ